MAETLQDYFVLNNNVKMPKLGLGTYKSNDGKEVIQAVAEALTLGYRHIDTAKMYDNEEGVGKGIKKSRVPRKEIFVVSKIWPTDHGYESTLKAFEESLQTLDLDYLDLFLIHWPYNKNIETWKALEKLYKKGKIKAIGVSNFKIHHLEELLNEAEIVPAVNQVEYHVRLQQDDLFNYCSKHKIQLEAYAPLMRGKILEIPILQQIAKSHNKTIPQINLRWMIQKGIATIPKSSNPNRIAENSGVFDFALTNDEMRKIELLNENTRMFPDPDHMTF